MKLLKIIAFLFLLYLIRRFYQLYRAMKKIQEEQALRAASEQMKSEGAPANKVVDAEYKVVD